MNDSDRYSSNKAFRFPHHLAAIRMGAPLAPVHLQFVLSDLCNQSCAFCSYRDPGYMSSELFHIAGNYNPNRKLPLEKVIEVLDDCKWMGVKAVQFTGGGEPTVHPDFQEAVDSATSRGLKWGLISNGVRLHKFDVAAASWIRISVDAATPATYSRIRHVPSSHFDAALKSIERLRCGTGFVVTEDNWREVAAGVRLYKSLGATNVRIVGQFTGDNSLPFYADALELVAEAAREETAEFKVFNRFVDKYDEIQTPPTDALCGYQYFTTFLGADQNLYRCCVYAYNPRGLLGSLKGRRFREAWPEIAAGFRSFDATKCVGCHYKSINRGLAYALADRTTDEEFV